MNLFLCCVSRPAPTSNYRGEAERNRSVLQKIAVDDQEYPFIAPEALRYALREMLSSYGLPCNRRRERNAEQLAVSFEDFPDPDKYADDFYFGYMVANRDQIPADRRDTFVYKRDSVLRTNLAVGLTPYRQETVLSQSPLTIARDSPSAKPAWRNSESSALLEREVAYTAFQFPLALNLRDCGLNPAMPEAVRNVWFAHLLLAITELGGVGGNHARSHFEMAPASVIARLTPRRASGFSLYPFTSTSEAPEVVQALLNEDLAGEGVHLGGDIVRQLTPKVATDLAQRPVTLHRTTEALFTALSLNLCGLPLPLK